MIAGLMVALLAVSGVGGADPDLDGVLDPEDQEKGAAEAEPSDLTLMNFFTEGWIEDWVKRSRKGRTPDMALLRVTTNFLEREFRLDYVYTNNVRNSAKVENSQLLNGLIAYGLNRRLMIEVISNYQWNEPPAGSTALKANGAGGAALVRFQLADTVDQCYGLQCRVSAPNRGIGQTNTVVSPSLAGFQDLQTILGLDQVGLYESITYDSATGPHAPGARTQDISYALSIARTWTDTTAYPVGKLTTFLELFATTDMSGTTEHHTGVTLTPGVRFWFAHENSLTFGVDFPVSEPHPFSNVFRVTYILNF
jgi:hypothetical protein